MKKYTFYLVIMLVILTGCEDYLTEQPKVGIAAETFVNSYDKALSILATSYAKLGDKENGLLGSERFMMPTDLRESWGTMGAFDYNSSTEEIKNMWSKYYSFISNVNFAISNIEEKATIIDETFEESNIETSGFISNFSGRENFLPSNMLLGEARFLRAYAYFTLYRYFGGVPIIEELQSGELKFIPRANREEIFDFIENDLQFALENCVANNDGGQTVAFGRIVKGAAAALLVKSYVFHASYIRRSEQFGSEIGEAVGGVDKTSLYDKAIQMADRLINKEFGDHELVDYYPSAFTSANSEVLFSAVASNGSAVGANVASIWGIGGSSINGAQNGQHSTSLHALIYDLPTWARKADGPVANGVDFGSTFKGMAQAWGSTYGLGMLDGFSEDVLHRELIEKYHKFSFTGDSTRRMWSTVKLYVTGSDQNQNNIDLEDGMWIFEPFGSYTEDALGNPLGKRDYFIAPNQGTDGYTDMENAIMRKYFGWPDTRWQTSSLYSKNAYSMGFWRLTKFRRAHPSDLPEGFDNDWAGVDYPILRLAEVYLLKAEALFFNGKHHEAIAELNKVRDRARNHAIEFVDLFDLGGGAPHVYVANQPIDIPNDLPEEQVIREILWERVRELSGEDDCRWLDIARFPDLLAGVYDEMEFYRDPLHRMGWFWQKGMKDRFNNTDKVYKVLFPIPLVEFQYFPNMRQNNGY